MDNAVTANISTRPLRLVWYYLGREGFSAIVSISSNNKAGTSQAYLHTLLRPATRQH